MYKNLIQGKDIILIVDELSTEQNNLLITNIKEDPLIINDTIEPVKINTETPTYIPNIKYLDITKIDDITHNTYIVNKIKHIRYYNINQYKTPILEETKLYSYMTSAYKLEQLSECKILIILLDILKLNPNSIYITGFNSLSYKKLTNISNKTFTLLRNILTNPIIKKDNNLYNILHKNVIIKYNPYCNHSTELIDILDRYKKEKNNNLQITKTPIKYDKPEIVPRLVLYIDDKIVKEHIGVMSYMKLVDLIETPQIRLIN